MKCKSSMLILSYGAEKNVRVTDGRPQTGWVFYLTKNRCFWNVTSDRATCFCIYCRGGVLLIPVVLRVCLWKILYYARAFAKFPVTFFTNIRYDVYAFETACITYMPLKHPMLDICFRNILHYVHISVPMLYRILFISIVRIVISKKKKKKIYVWLFLL